MADCPSQELLESYMAGACSPDDRRRVKAHLEGCSRCREFVESAGEDTDNSPRSLCRPDSPTMTVSDATQTSHAKHGYAESFRSLIQGYEIIDELPRGGQAVVYRATHLATKTTVAIKVLLPTLLASERARYYFEREAEMIAGLDHPNIVKIRDSGIIHGQYFFVMEYIEGHPLDRYAAMEALSFRDRILLCRKLCRAVAYAHQQGIIHRDLKFGNILVDGYGEPHILDFGVAKAVGLSEESGREVVATMTGQWAGSLSTMSPEQAAGRPALIDVRTDVYALGVILYHLLTGRYPYDVTGPTVQVIKNIQAVEPVRPRRIIRRFDSDIEAILLTALAKERRERYQSAADLLADIDNWLDARPIRVRSLSTMYLLRKIVARHRYTTTVVALLLLIVLSFGYISFDQYLVARRAKADAEAVARHSTRQAAEVLALLRQIVPFTFPHFLEAWHDGKTAYAGRMAKYFDEGSREQRAAVFLLTAASSADSREKFRRALSDDQLWFADFILGEYYLKNDNEAEALKAYRSSYESIRRLQKDNLPFDNWVRIYVTARLYQLSTE